VDLCSEQHLARELVAANPPGLVPALVLVLGKGRVLAQSPAILCRL
jgi:glutathione S-transferase